MGDGIDDHGVGDDKDKNHFHDYDESAGLQPRECGFGLCDVPRGCGGDTLLHRWAILV